MRLSLATCIALLGDLARSPDGVYYFISSHNRNMHGCCILQHLSMTHHSFMCDLAELELEISPAHRHLQMRSFCSTLLHHFSGFSQTDSPVSEFQ